MPLQGKEKINLSREELVKGITTEYEEYHRTNPERTLQHVLSVIRRELKKMTHTALKNEYRGVVTKNGLHNKRSEDNVK